MIRMGNNLITVQKVLQHLHNYRKMAWTHYNNLLLLLLLLLLVLVKHFFKEQDSWKMTHRQMKNNREYKNGEHETNEILNIIWNYALSCL